jgi:preprotein translocase subunit SecG
MNWLHTAVVILHLLFAAAIVALVLLQRGKGADAGAGFGAGASGTVFGARGSASFLSRTTATLAVLFIGTSLTLAYMGSRAPDAPKSVIDRVKLPDSDTVPALPSVVPAPPAGDQANNDRAVEPPVEPVDPPAQGEPPKQ